MEQEIDVTPHEFRPVPKWRSTVALLLLCAYILAAVFRSTQKTSEAMLPSNLRDFFVLCAYELGLFSFVWLGAVALARTDVDELRLRWRGGWQPVWSGVLYSLAIRFALGLCLVLVAMVLSVGALAMGMKPEGIAKAAEGLAPGHNAIVDLVKLADDPLYQLVLATWGSFVVAGLREELWRAAMLALGTRLLQPLFSQRNALIGALAFSSVLFGLGHLYQGWLVVAMTTLIGAMLGGIMIKHRSIWPAVIAHGAFDALSFLMLPVASELLKHQSKMLPW